MLPFSPEAAIVGLTLREQLNVGSAVEATVTLNVVSPSTVTVVTHWCTYCGLGPKYSPCSPKQFRQMEAPRCCPRRRRLTASAAFPEEANNPCTTIWKWFDPDVGARNRAARKTLGDHTGERECRRRRGSDGDAWNVWHRRRCGRRLPILSARGHCEQQT